MEEETHSRLFFDSDSCCPGADVGSGAISGVCMVGVGCNASASTTVAADRGVRRQEMVENLMFALESVVVTVRGGNRCQWLCSTQAGRVESPYEAVDSSRQL